LHSSHDSLLTACALPDVSLRRGSILTESVPSRSRQDKVRTSEISGSPPLLPLTAPRLLRSARAREMLAGMQRHVNSCSLRRFNHRAFPHRGMLLNYARSPTYRDARHPSPPLSLRRKCTPAIAEETAISRRRQLAPGDSKIRYLRNYCINVGRAPEIWHGSSRLPPPAPLSGLPPAFAGRSSGRSRYPSCLRQLVLAKHGKT